MMEKFIKDNVDIVDLLLDPENPRFDPIHHQREALENQLQSKNYPKLITLAEDILKYGPDPSQRPIVTKEAGGKYVVREGNRRTAVLQLLSNPHLTSSLISNKNTASRLTKLAAEFKKNPIKKIECVIYDEYTDEVKHWIKLKHTGENEGAGTVQWDGKASARFQGGSVGLQAIELVLKNVDLNEDERRLINSSGMKVTTVTRLLETPAEARSILGFELNEKVLQPIGDLKKSMSNLTRLLLDVAGNGSNKISSRTINSAESRIAEAKKLVGRAQPRKLISGANFKKEEKKEPPSKKQPKALRKTVATKKRIPISQPRAEAIYSELQHIPITRFSNAAAILIRVFFEFSVDEYGDKNSLDFHLYDRTGKKQGTKQISFSKKILKTIEHMEKSGRPKHITAQARTMATDPNKLFYFENLHGYIHNPHSAPLQADLPKIWDNLQAFAEELWAPAP